MLAPYVKTPAALEHYRSGPAGPHLDAFIVSLEARGYPPRRMFHLMRGVKRFSCWAQATGFTLQELDAKVSETISLLQTKEAVAAGSLMSYGPNFADLYRRGAIYVDKILKSAKPADLPVEQAMKLELVLHFKTAQALGVTFPPTLLILADEVIK